MSKRCVVPSVARMDKMPGCGTLSTALPQAALALLLATTDAPVGAMPLRESEGLAISCRIEGLPPGESEAAQAALCARVVGIAARGAPYPVGLARSAVTAPSLELTAIVTADAAHRRRVSITARLARPGQPETASRLTAASPPVAYDDAGAVGAAIETALAVLPWHNPRRSQVPSPPKAY